MSSPRISDAQIGLGEYNGKTVRYVGKLDSQQGSNLVLLSHNGGRVRVQLTSAETPVFATGTHVEVIGTVVSNERLIRARAATDFGATFNLKNHDAFVELQFKYPEPF